MATTTSMQVEDSKLSLLMLLKRQPGLYDLHTHLMGMGSSNFWIDMVMMDDFIMPPHKSFIDHEHVRTNLCPLVWDKKDDTGFVDGDESAKFFRYLIKNNILPTTEKFTGFIEKINEKKEYSSVLLNLLKNQELNGELINRKLNFGVDFSYDVVLKLTDLGHALGIEETEYPDLTQLAVADRLGINVTSNNVHFRHLIIFNAREQRFEVVYGIQVADLRSLIMIDPRSSTEAHRAARAHLVNAFSMCNAQGTSALHADLHGFQGSFTPKFYPQRFALKDSIYSQRLDILGALIAHTIERYTTSLPPVRYCEFSVSVRDLSRPWIYDVLRSVKLYKHRKPANHERCPEKRTYRATQSISSFAQMVLEDRFPHLEFAFKGTISQETKNTRCTTSPFTYKFLAGFDRRRVKIFPNQAETTANAPRTALRLLHDFPQKAILFMMEEITKSSQSRNLSEKDVANKSDPFADYVEKLNAMDSMSKKMPGFYNWIVGLDLFGDELGYPYCPFVARPFINFILKRRNAPSSDHGNKRFGIRIHCGENVPYASDDSPAYRLFIAHMYIVFCCLRFLKQELECGIRIGHGIAFNRLLEISENESTRRKSSILKAEMRHQAKKLFESIAFEVNITSNEYLLGSTLRDGNLAQMLRLDTLEKLNAPIILATDDDGIWPIDQCPLKHPGHQSLPAEYCRAISSSLIKSSSQLLRILENTRNFCFSDQGGIMPKPKDSETALIDSRQDNTIIIHPDIIKNIRSLYEEKNREINPAFNRFEIDDGQTSVHWDDVYGPLRVAFICIRANYDLAQANERSLREEIHNEYQILFPNPNDDKEFDTLYKNWMRVRCGFLYPKLEKQSGNMGHHVKLEQQDGKMVYIYSPPQQDNLETLTHPAFLGFSDAIKWAGVTIYAYLPHLNQNETVDTFTERRQYATVTEEYQNMVVNIYTNRDKYTYTAHGLDQDFKLNVNPHMSKRERSTNTSCMLSARMRALQPLLFI